MPFSIKQLNQLSDIALDAVKMAGHYIQHFDRSRLQTNYKDSGSSLSAQVVTEVDLHCQSIILKALQPCSAELDIAILSEENCSEIPINQHPRLNKHAFWCIDPLDGTLPFIEGREGYAVSIALVDQQGLAIIAAIHLPATNEDYQVRYSTQKQAVVYKNGKRYQHQSPGQFLYFYCDQSFVNTEKFFLLCKKLTLLAASLNLVDLKVVSGNGAVVNGLLTMQSSTACYIKLPKPQQGGGALWDFSGTACINQVLEGWVTDTNGQPLALNQADSYYMNNKGIIFASNKTLGQAILEVVTAIKEQ